MRHFAFMTMIALTIAALVVVGCGPKKPQPQPDKPGVPAEVMPTGPNADKQAVTLGLRAANSNNYAKAERYFQHAVASNPYNVDGAFNLGVAQLKLGKGRDAAANFTKVLNIRADYPRVREYLGMSQLLAGEYNRALSEFRTALAADPDNLELQNGMAVAYIRMKRYNQAENLLRDILRENANFVQAHINMALLYLNRDKPGMALQILRNAQKIDSTNSAVEANMGYIYQEMKKLNKAKNHFEKAVSLDPNNADALGNLGGIELRFKQLDRAYGHLSKAASLTPGNAVVMVNYGAACREKGSFAEAETAYKKAIAADPTLANAYHNLGILYAMDLDRPKDAIANFRLYLQYSRGDDDRNERVKKWINDLQGKK